MYLLSSLFAETHPKELYGISDLLKVALGPDFYHSATYNTENHVSHKVPSPNTAFHPNSRQINELSQVILGVGFVPSPQAVDNCLWSIAQTYKVDWLPSPSAQEKCVNVFPHDRHFLTPNLFLDRLNVLPSLLDESDVVTPVDLQTVRRICASGRHTPHTRSLNSLIIPTRNSIQPAIAKTKTMEVRPQCKLKSDQYSMRIRADFSWDIHH